MNDKKILKIVAILLFISIIILTTIIIVSLDSDLEEYKEVSNTQTKIIDEVVNESKEKGEEPFSLDWDKLLSINKDIVAWIRIPDSNINYPVVKGKTNDQYLHENIYGNYSRGGTPFVDTNIKIPFNSPNTIIYGHNLINGLMFSEIKKYSNNNFYKSHNIIYIYLPNGEIREYKVIAFHIINAQDKNIFNPYIVNIEEYTEYMFQNNIITGIDNEIYSNDKIITLSTCTNVKENERYVLHALWQNKI